MERILKKIAVVLVILIIVSMSIFLKRYLFVYKYKAETEKYKETITNYYMKQIYTEGSTVNQVEYFRKDSRIKKVYSSSSGTNMVHYMDLPTKTEIILMNSYGSGTIIQYDEYPYDSWSLPIGPFVELYSEIEIEKEEKYNEIKCYYVETVYNHMLWINKKNISSS